MLNVVDRIEFEGRNRDVLREGPGLAALCARLNLNYGTVTSAVSNLNRQPPAPGERIDHALWVNTWLDLLDEPDVDPEPVAAWMLARWGFLPPVRRMALLLRDGETPLAAFLRLSRRVGEIAGLLERALSPESEAGPAVGPGERRALLAELAEANVAVQELALMIEQDTGKPPALRSPHLWPVPGGKSGA